MKSGYISLNEITGQIAEKKLRNEDSIIIGDNSSGKSQLLKQIISQMEKKEGIYFIDAVNRSFDIKDVTREKKKPEYKKTILNTRLQENYFNLTDSFCWYGSPTERVEEIVSEFKRKGKHERSIETGKQGILHVLLWPCVH